MDLNDGWEFRRVGDSVWYPAKVPGCVHTDLFRNKLIPDPFFGDNEKQLQWIENEDWEYRKTFVADSQILNSEGAIIQFEGVDTYSRIYLNDSWILETEDMFISYKFDIKKYLKIGSNFLRVYIESPVKRAAKIKKPPELPGGDQVNIRKAPYMYGWDWGPRFITSGIWKGVYLEAADSMDGKYFGYSYQINKLDTNAAEVTFAFRCNNTYGRKDRFTFLDDKENVLGSFLLGEFENVGLVSNSIKIKIEKPNLWWCNGLGRPAIYKYMLIQEVGGDRLEHPVKFALRKIELDQTPNVSGGSNFQFKLNGVLIYIKGANYVPPHSFPTEVTKEDHRRLIDDAVRSNFNMLRVWGGGYYETDDFYDLCDENGILVWQDFMFACAMYPGNSNFLDQVQTEAEQNVQRLGKHPCIALWCGNNEIDEGWHNWGWQEQFKYSVQDSTKIWNDYRKIFEDILPSYVKDYGNGVPYIPSSPKIGWGHPESMKEGDSHYWGVWWGNEPFEMYEKKVPRFMSEFGFQSFPDIKTIESFTNPEDRYLGSPVMKARQKHPVGYETIQTYMEREYKQPKDFESYIYVSQLLQAYGIKRAIEAERRAKPDCMGTLYWQFNDCWPVVSWSGIDYYGRWKALQYFVKDAYRDILVSTVKENDELKVYVVSDKLNDLPNCKLRLSLTDFYGNIHWSNSMVKTIKANSSIIYDWFPVDILPEFDTTKMCFVASLDDGNGNIYRSIYYFAEPRNLMLEKPHIEFEALATDDLNSFHLRLNTDKLAKNVHLSFYPYEVTLNDDYFDLLPNTLKTVVVSQNREIDMAKIMQNLKVTTLVESY